MSTCQRVDETNNASAQPPKHKVMTKQELQSKIKLNEEKMQARDESPSSPEKSDYYYALASTERQIKDESAKLYGIHQ